MVTVTASRASSVVNTIQPTMRQRAETRVISMVEFCGVLVIEIPIPLVIHVVIARDLHRVRVLVDLLRNFAHVGHGDTRTYGRLGDRCRRGSVGFLSLIRCH